MNTAESIAWAVTAHLEKIKTDILPLLIAVLLVIVSIWIVMTSNYILTGKHYWGFGSLSVSIILYFFNKKIYYPFFAFILTLGLVNFLDFYITSYKIGFANVGVNPIFLILMITFFAVSRRNIDMLSGEKKTENHRELDQSMIKSFEKRFTDKNRLELTEITEANSKYTAEAKVAAKNILKNKNVL